MQARKVVALLFFLFVRSHGKEEELDGRRGSGKRDGGRRSPKGGERRRDGGRATKKAAGGREEGGEDGGGASRDGVVSFRPASRVRSACVPGVVFLLNSVSFRTTPGIIYHSYDCLLTHFLESENVSAILLNFPHFLLRIGTRKTVCDATGANS